MSVLLERELQAMTRLRELLRAGGERAIVGAVVRHVAGVAMVQSVIANADPAALRAAAAEFIRLADAQEAAQAPKWPWVRLPYADDSDA